MFKLSHSQAAKYVLEIKLVNRTINECKQKGIHYEIR